MLSFPLHKLALCGLLLRSILLDPSFEHALSLIIITNNNTVIIIIIISIGFWSLEILEILSRRRFRDISNCKKTDVLTSYFIGHERNLDPDVHTYFHTRHGYCSTQEDPVEYFSRPNGEPDTKCIYGLLHLFLVKILPVNQDRRVLRATYITWQGFAKDYHRHHKSYSLHGVSDRLDQQPPTTFFFFLRLLKMWEESISLFLSLVRIQGRTDTVNPP